LIFKIQTMNKLLTFFVCCIALNAFSQSTFGPVEKNGFGKLQVGVGYNSSVIDMTTFKGKLYVGMGEDSGYVYRSATGDLGTFQKVFSEGGTFRMGNFETTAENGGYLYAATYNDAGYYHYAKRTSDGYTWENYLESYNQYDRVEAINAFKGIQTVDSIYLVVRNNMGYNFLIRNSVDQNDPYNSSLTWDTVADILSPFGAAGEVKASIVFNNKLYYAMDNNELYETADGRTLSLNPNYDTEMGYSSGSGVDRIVSMESFGGYLYFGTHTSFGGAQLWRTADGITFDSLGVVNPSIPTLVSMKSSGSKLFMIVRDFSGYYEIYSTVDGSTFVLEDNTELGDANTNMQSHAPMEIFNDHLYVGTTQDMGGFRLANNGNNVLNTNSYGAQIYRTCLIGTMPAVTIIEGDTTVVCSGVSATLSATGSSNYLWNNANTSAFLSTTTPGYYAVTGIEGSGCRNSDGAYILNPSSLSPIVYENYYQVFSGVVCSGDTTAPITALDPANDYNCLFANGTDMGLTTPTGTSINSSDLTIEAWIKPNTSGVIATEYDPNYLWTQNDFAIMRIAGTYADEFYVELPNVGSTFVGYISPSQWNHVVLRYNATTKVLDGLVNGYQGGYAYSGVDHTPASSAGYDDAFKFLMSSVNPYVEGNAIAKIRDIRIWNVARTDSAIAADKHKLPVGVYPNLINHYELLETSGVTAADSSTSNLTATVTGTFVSPTPVTWINAPGMNVIGFNTAEFFPTQNTQYALQYTDTYGCLVVDSFKVEPAFLQVRGLPAAACGFNSASLDFISNLPINGPQWTSTSLGTVQTFSVNVTPASEEWVYVSDNTTGCLVQDSILVKVGPAFTSNTMLKGPPIHVCENSDYVVDAQAVGGTGPFTFIWQIGNLPPDTTNSSFYSINVGTTNTNIDVYGYDAIGCPFEGAYLNVYGDLASTDLTGHITTPPPTSLNVDNGFVYVFKHQPGNAGFDTVGYTPLDANGNYSFAPLTAGDYLIKVMPDEISFPDAVPTYYGNAFQWDSSDVFTHGCDMPYTADIQVVEASGPVGTASVSGYIIEEQGFGNNRYGIGNGNNTPFVPGGPLKGIDVKLGKNPGGGIQARTMSDSTGFYIFDSIPVGGYKIYVDIPNLPMDSTRELNIANGDSSIQNNYFADDSSIYINENIIVGIFASEKVYENNFSIYPNPAKGTIYLNYELTERAKVSFEIINAMGQKIKVEQERNYPQGKNIFVLDLESLHLNGGVYFVSMLTKDKKYTQRIVVID